MSRLKSETFDLGGTLRSIVDDQTMPLRAKLLKLTAEALRPKPEAIDTRTAAAESSLYEFMRQGWHVLEPTNPFVEAWHLGCICEHLQAVNRLEIRDIVINIPPRHAKSLAAAVFWFVWTWVHDPGSRWLFTSYAAHLSERDSEKCRTLIRSNWFQTRWGNVFRIKPAEDTKSKFVNDHQGFRIATSVGGVGTGEGGDYIVADDPLKTDEALSDAALKRAVHNWDQTMSTRGNNPATVRKIIIMQRLAERDLSGHVLAGERGYEHLCLPAEYEPKRYFIPSPRPDPEAPAPVKPRDAIIPTKLQRARPELMDGPTGSGRRDDGEPLWPQRFGADEIRKLKAELGARGWAGQGLQRPNPAEGTIFQAGTFRYFAELMTAAGLRIFLGVREEGMPPPASYLATECRWFQTIDTALTLKKTSAWTCVGTFALTPCRNLLVWDIWRERLLVPKQYKAIQQMRDGRGVYDPATMRWTTPGKARPWPASVAFQAVESKASGIGLIQTAQLEGRPFRVLTADVDKVRRAAPLATLFEGGQVYFREAARGTWLTDYEGELLAFPGGAFADQVDVTSYAAQLATGDALTNLFSRYEGELIVDGGGGPPVEIAEMTESQLASWLNSTGDIEDGRDDEGSAWWRR